MFKLHFSSLKRGFHNLRAVNEELFVVIYVVLWYFLDLAPPKLPHYFSV